MSEIGCRNPATVCNYGFYRFLSVSDGNGWFWVTGSVQWNIASIKSPEQHRTGRFCAKLFDLGQSHGSHLYQYLFALDQFLFSNKCLKINLTKSKSEHIGTKCSFRREHTFAYRGYTAHYLQLLYD